MSFRLRVTLLATVAVAIAVMGAATLMYLIVQRQFVGQVDELLESTATLARAASPRPAGPFGRVTLIAARPDIFAQVVTRTGDILRADGAPIPALVTAAVRDVAAGSQEPFFDDIYVQGEARTYHVRVYVVPFGNGLALELARQVDEIDAALAVTRRLLFGIAAGGVLLAAALGAVVAQGALGPLRKLSQTVEEVRRTRDLSRRVAAGSGSDELSRLAYSFDEMLTALEMSLRQQRQLVADASHELRTPLTSLRVNLELLARGQPTDPAEQQQLLEDLVAQIERLSTLVGDLIDLARDEEVPLPIENVRLDEVAATAMDEVKSRYPAIAFRADLHDVTVRGVRPRIARAVTNLLDNAAKWSPPGATVEVSVAGGEVTVRDHGPGVSPEDAPHVFDRFWRAASARNLPGSGLGLSIVKQVAETHGGSVTLEHPTDGGARFRLRLSGSSSPA